MRHGIGWLVAALLLAGSVAGADGQAAPEAPSLRAARADGRPPRIDGRLDDAAWSAAAAAGGFSQYEPRPGAPASQRTEARVLYDDGAIYVAIRAFDSAPDSVAGQRMRRDAESYSDWVGVMIDSRMDRRTAFQFSVNPAGVRLDQRWHDDTEEDPSWDPVWEAAVARDADGWTAELRIPLSQLRFRGGGVAAGEWGLNFHRTIARLGEEDVWAPTSPSDGAVVSRFGRLTGLDGLEGGNRLELLPHVSVRTQNAAGPEAASGGAGARADAGLDLKYGLTPDLTLDVAVNPDYGQVEADPARVNLTAFETVYPERRPFFLESADLFDLRISVSEDEDERETLFYSRRIGRPPQGVEAGGFASPPAGTTILGAAKVSGRTAAGWSVGVLSAVTAEERATSVTDRTAVVVEPRTSYTVARVRRELRDGRTSLGLLGTAVARERGAADALGLHRLAWTAGVDARHRFAGDRLEASGFLVASRVQGSAAAVLRTQRSPTHLFQRPDARHLRLDSTLTSLSGATARATVRKVAGGPWRGVVGFQTRTPGFEVNDLGYQRYSDYRLGWVEAGYERSSPMGPFRSWELYSSAWTTYTTGGERYEAVANLRGEARFRGLWGVYAGVEHDRGGFSPWALRGGPLLRREAETQAWGGAYTDDRRGLSGGLEVSGAARPESDSWGVEVSPGLTWRASGAVTVRGGPFFARRVEDQQWLGATETEPPAYVLGRLDQRTAGATLRVDAAFTRTLTLQLYAQPYVSAGRYLSFQRVVDARAASRSARFAPIGAARTGDGRYRGDLDGDGDAETFDDPSFGFRQFRSTTVLRWAFRPGSTVYLVWSQGRSDLVGDGRFRPGPDIRHLFDTRPDDVLMLKVSYWIGR